MLSIIWRRGLTGIMRTLAMLVALLVGLAFVFWAPTAKADCPHKGNFDHPHCGGGEPPPLSPSPLVVRDDDGKLEDLQYSTDNGLRTFATENNAGTKPQRRAVLFRLRSVAPPSPWY